MRVFVRRSHRTRSATGIASLLVTAVLVAGCGSGSLSHAALVTRADTACQSANAAVSRFGVPATSLSGLTHYASQVLPISEKLETQLSALKPSSTDKPKLSALVSALQNGNQGLTLMAKATSTAQTNKAGQLIIAQSVPKAANALGAASCASSPSA